MLKFVTVFEVTPNYNNYQKKSLTVTGTFVDFPPPPSSRRLDDPRLNRLSRFPGFPYLLHVGAQQAEAPQVVLPPLRPQPLLHQLGTLRPLAPLQVLPVFPVVLAEEAEVASELPRRVEVVGVDERARRRHLEDVLLRRAPHHGDGPRPETVEPELFGHVVSARNGVLEGEVELVLADFLVERLGVPTSSDLPVAEARPVKVDFQAGVAQAFGEAHAPPVAVRNRPHGHLAPRLSPHQFVDVGVVVTQQFPQNEMDAAVGGVHVRVRPVAEGHVVEIFAGFRRAVAVQRAFLLPKREYLVIFSVCC